MQPRGVIVFGAAGSGTTTIGRSLAQQLRLTHIDVDAYSWQDLDTPKAGRIPHAQRVPALQKAIANSPGFVMSGSICGWGDVFIPLLDLAVFVYTPTDIRLQRLREREYGQFGKRVAEGGDMYERFCWFIEYAGKYDTGSPPIRCRELHEEWIKQLPCPVVRVDGTEPIEKNITDIIDTFAK